MSTTLGDVDAWRDTTLASLNWTGFYAVLFLACKYLAPRFLEHVRAIKNTSELHHWCSVVGSYANTIILTPLAWKACRESGFLAADASMFTHTPLSTASHHAMIGYTIYDLVLIVTHPDWQTSRSMYILHHTCVIFGWSVSCVTGQCHSTACAVMLVEGTGLFVNLRHLLSAAGMKSTRLYLYNGFAMLFSFFAVRICFNYWLGLRLYWCRDQLFRLQFPWWWLPCLQAINMALQGVWFVKIAKGGLAFLLEGKKKAE